MNIEEFAAKYLDEKIPTHQMEMQDFIEAHTNCLVLEPREHGKSTTMRRWLLWRLCHDPSLRVLIASHKEEVADEFARDILMHLEREDLQQDFGFTPGKPWRVGQAYLKSDKPLNRKSTATLGTVAKMSGVTGKRFDMLIMDDPFDSKDILTEKQRHKLKHWIDAELLNTVDHDVKRKMVVFGTRKHIEDWYGQLMQMPHWSILKRQLYTIKDGVKTYLWPERFNEEIETELRAQMDPDVFAMEYMNEPMASEGLRFKREWIEPYYYTDWEVEVPERWREIYIGIDPSVGSKTDRASYMGLAVVCFDKRPQMRNIYVVDLVRSKLSLAEQADIIVAKLDEWRPHAAMIESVLINKIFSDRMLRELPILQPVVYRGNNASTGLTGTTDISKIGRIENIVGWLCKRGKIRLKDPRISPMSKTLIEEEYLQFPEGSLDLLDALNMACDRIDVRAQLKDLTIWKF